MESFFDRQLSVSVDQWCILSKVCNFLSNVYGILPKSPRPSTFRLLSPPILGHSDNFPQILYWFDIHRQILSLLAQLMSASVKSCRIFSYQGTNLLLFVTWCRGLTPSDRGCRILVTICRIVKIQLRSAFFI